MHPFRKKKLENQIRKVISDIFIQKVHNFGIGYVTFTECELSKDFSRAKVFFSIFPNDEQTIHQAYKKLIKLQKFFQFQLTSHLKIRNIPNVTFHINKSSLEVKIAP